MNGQTQIKEIKSAVTFKKKGNEIIARINLPWDVKLPDDNFGIGQVQYSEKKITIDLSQLSTGTFVVCDIDGNQRNFTAIGFFEDEL